MSSSTTRDDIITGNTRYDAGLRRGKHVLAQGRTRTAARWHTLVSSEPHSGIAPAAARGTAGRLVTALTFLLSRAELI